MPLLSSPGPKRGPLCSPPDNAPLAAMAPAGMDLTSDDGGLTSEFSEASSADESSSTRAPRPRRRAPPGALALPGLSGLSENQGAAEAEAQGAATPVTEEPNQKPKTAPPPPPPPPPEDLIKAKKVR